MTDEEFDQYLDEALDELDAKHAGLIEKYGIGDDSDFSVDYEKQSLLFFENGNPVIEAQISPLATHDPAQNSLSWFCFDPNVTEAVRKISAPIKTLHDITASDLFTSTSIECGETMIWEIGALACKGLGSIGMFRVPQDRLNAYVLIDAIKHYD